MRIRKPAGLKGGNLFLKSQSSGFVYWQWTRPDGKAFHVVSDLKGRLYEVRPWGKPTGRMELMQAAKAPRQYTYGGPKIKFMAWSYDVVGNARDGYEVNDRSKIGEFEADEGTWENERTLKQLAKEILGLKRNIRLSSIDVDGDDQAAYFTYAPDGYPLGEFITEE